jgi:hypothetical protein
VTNAASDAGRKVLAERGLSEQGILEKFRLFYGYSEVAQK